METVVLLGKGSLAIKVAEWFAQSSEYELQTVVPVVPEPTWTDSLSDWCGQNSIARVESGDYNELAGKNFDLAVSVFYDKILKPAFIDSCERCINLHNGPLPRYRGVSPINWALLNGEAHHGATIHEITPGVDDGPIVSQVTYSIFPDVDEVEDVYARALAFGWTLFEQTIPILELIKATPQDDSDALTYTKKDDGRLGNRAGFRRV